ncbi:hypothetical protein ISN45_Aa08g027280 [Arabidopsis thaliana x Arabidopsis arenosa]|uniref:Plant thionin family protein n=1 Tax=Arabidopsis thaliana x Arabidopsis arenosa TaxID=1240361 RepID=A0A8T1XM25_9BRAS|nr:hypothetical protein ISN45_Aa08g027280 [Arabidopsis thaliana x Arabidopsis arenosa]
MENKWSAVMILVLVVMAAISGEAADQAADPCAAVEKKCLSVCRKRSSNEGILATCVIFCVITKCKAFPLPPNSAFYSALYSQRKTIAEWIKNEA